MMLLLLLRSPENSDEAVLSEMPEKRDDDDATEADDSVSLAAALALALALANGMTPALMLSVWLATQPAGG